MFPHQTQFAIVPTRSNPFQPVPTRSDSVDVWVTNNVITQIGAHGAYRGRLLDHIVLGMTIVDIEPVIDPCMEDIEDILAIVGVEGLCFDVAWRPDHFVPDLDWRLPEFRF